MSPITILARNASAWTGSTGNNTYLLAGAVPTLIDAGVGHPEHVEEIAAALGSAALEAVLITHGHSDHVAGLPALRERWSDLRVHATRFPSDLPAGDGRLRPIHTPGHSPDHFCFLDEDAGDLYCGDLLRLNGTIVIPASRGGNLRDYLESLRRIRALRPRRLLPGHGPAVADADALIDGYLAHRADRERQVVQALARGRTTADALVPLIYGRLPAGLDAAAAESVLAHLMKLEEEGRAVKDDDGVWRCVR